MRTLVIPCASASPTRESAGSLHEIRPGRRVFLQKKAGSPQGQHADQALGAILMHGACCHRQQVTFHSQVMHPACWADLGLIREAQPPSGAVYPGTTVIKQWGKLQTHKSGVICIQQPVGERGGLYLR